MENNLKKNIYIYIYLKETESLCHIPKTNINTVNQLQFNKKRLTWIMIIFKVWDSLTTAL